MKKLRDAVHGDIELSSFELSILNTPVLQRLRGIKQLGTTHLVYPCAVHTRFEHSYGTCFLAKRIIEHINRNMQQLYGVVNAISESETELLSLVALLHDISHIPYGHTFEDERKLFDRHDTRERIEYFLNDRGLKKILGSLRAEVLKILSVKSSRGIPRGESRPYLFQIVCDTICGDLLDYVARDVYFCGLTGGYDSRIFSNFILDKQNNVVIDLVKDNGLFRPDIFSEVVNLLRLRYLLTERVYFHHTKVAAGAMISKAMEGAIERGVKQESLYKYSDEMFLSFLERSTTKTGKKIITRFSRRELYKKAYVVTRNGIDEQMQDHLIELFHASSDTRRQAEEEIARRAAEKKIPVNYEDIIIYCPGKNMSFKEAQVFVRASLVSKARPLCEYNNPEVDVLVDKYKNLWRFFLFVSAEKLQYFDRISQICEEYFGASNEIVKEQKGQLMLGLKVK